MRYSDIIRLGRCHAQNIRGCVDDTVFCLFDLSIFNEFLYFVSKFYFVISAIMRESKISMII